MFLYLMLEQTEENVTILESYGFDTMGYLDWLKPLGHIFLYTQEYSAFMIGKYDKSIVAGTDPIATRLKIEPSQIPEIALLFNLGIYGEDLIPLLT